VSKIEAAPLVDATRQDTAARPRYALMCRSVQAPALRPTSSMANLSSSMTSGDCLVIARNDGGFDVYKLWAHGARQRVNVDTTERRTALQVALKQLTPDGTAVYFKEEAEPDSAIRPA
jgi:hypothetical protein